MYTGTVISELMELVARVEDHAQDGAIVPGREDELLASRFVYQATNSQPMMIGVA